LPPQDIVINFDDLPVNTVVTNQYHDRSLDFFGLLPVITQVPAGQAHSGHQVANISTCFGCEFFVPSVTGLFADTVSRISVFVGMFASPTPVDPAEITLSAFDVGDNLIVQSAPITVTAGGGFNTPLAVQSASANIASFEISARLNLDDNKQLGVDNLSFKHPEHAQPDFNLSSTLSIVQVAPGTSVSDLITVNHFNGSHGPIQFTVSGLPQGVTASFAPNPTSGNTALTLTAAASAPLTTGTIRSITIIATPHASSVGSATRTIQVGVQVQHNFTLSIQYATIDLAPCMSNASFTVDVSRRTSFQSQQIDLNISGLPPGVSATLNPSSVGAPPGGAFVNEVILQLTVTDESFPDADVTIKGQSGGETNTLTLHLHSIPGRIDNFTPTSGQTPQELHAGTEVVIQGAGFCQGSQVAFGSDRIFINGQQQPLAIAVPTSISADGRTIHVNVPRLATDGPLSVITPSSHTYVSNAQFTVDSYRNTDGFSFHNFDMNGVSFDDVVELFGYGQTHISLFWIPTPIPDPLALLFKLIADAALGGDGACHGFALSSQRLLHGDEALSSFPRSGDSVWLLNGPGGASSSLEHSIHVQHITQLSSEFLHYWLGQVASHLVLGVLGDGGIIKAQVIQAFTNNDHALVAIRNGTSGHVLVAYDIEDSATGPGDFYIDVYDPNDQFLIGENAQGQLHDDKTENSRILVQGNGNWSFPNLGWSAGFDSIVVVPYNIIPIQPTIPTSLSGLITVILGSGGKTTQLADNAGHTLLLPDGKLNKNPATVLPQAAPFAPLSSGASADIHVLEGAGPYIHTVQSTGNAPYTHTHLSQNFATRIENVRGSQGSGDEVTLDPQASGLGFRTWETHRSIRAHLLARAPDKDVRTAIFNTTSFKGHSDHFALDQSRANLTYTHAGPTTQYTIILEGTNPKGKRVSFVSSPLRIDADDTATFTPSDWHHLGRATVTLTVIRKDGSHRVETLKNSKPDPDDDDDHRE